MKTIAVTGGKGGTGKSSFAILLALHEINKGKRVVLVDCDVECPNDHILLGVSQLADPIQKTYNSYPRILEEKCHRCGLCVSKCKSSALFQLPGRVPTVKRDLCSSCGVCWTICPYHAIVPEDVQNGEIFSHVIRENLTLITGRSIPGVRETSPVVEQTRSYVDSISSSYDLVIIDTAAGSHCSVIRALEDVEKAYAVTEPTPLGAHDLNVILDVLRVLKIPSEIVLNRAGIGNDSIIRAVGEEKKVPLSIEIPYNKRFAELYTRGDLLDHEKDLISLVDLDRSTIS